MIEAAGGVVWRTTARHEHEVLLVHRPRRQDWSLPKGRRRGRETALECAVREVREETGLRCNVEDELPPVRYTDRRGRDRLIRYWAMAAVGGVFRPNREVDEIRWIAIAHVGQLLTEHELAAISGLGLIAAGIS